MSTSTEDLARVVRSDVVRMVHRARASHVASSLSVVDIVAVLYGSVLRHRPDDPSWSDRDRFILSKGHAAAAGYAVLARSGYFSADLLDTYCVTGSPLAGHLTASADAPGVEISTGSLGHGLPVGVGMALHLARSKSDARVYVVISDGECDEGSTWEAALLAAHHGLDALTVIVDNNRIQSFGRVEEVIRLEPFAEKWRSFGWAVAEIDGHDHDAIEAALTDRASGAPHAIVANTVKGRGVSFMEDDLAWHYRNPDDDQLSIALDEILRQR